MTGQMSLPRELFHRVGGFDTSFTLGGTFGDEDIDFGYRLMRAGYRLVFNPGAISWQKYVVQPREYLRQWRQAGNADVAFARKHPEQARAIFALNGSERRSNRLLWRPLVALSPLTVPLMALWRWLVLVLVDYWSQNETVVKLFYQVWAMEYWRGVWEAGGMPRPRPLRVLAYHAIKDLAGAPVLESYAVPPDLFRRQLNALQWARFQFVSADEFLQFLYGGGGLPRRPLLLTFDDGYEELLDVVLPILKERGIPAVAFVVSGRLGGANEWDKEIGAPPLRLLDVNDLGLLAKGGIEIGAHSRTHRSLTSVSDEELFEQIAGSVADLEAVGIERPRLFAYPYGEWDQRVRQVIQNAGLQAGFTVVCGRVRAGHDPHQVPRIEIMREDTGWKLLWKVIMAGRSIIPSARAQAETRR
jgi:peptidoglycan/xylan/chitin deacetylase (PgdA/CDA1 family)